MRRSSLLSALLWLLLLGVLALTVGGCGPHSNVPSGGSPAVTHLPHRNDLQIDVCIEASTGFDPLLRRAAQDQLAAGLEQAVRENSGSLTLIVGFADAKPFSPESTPLAVTLPAIDAYPQAPTLEPMPPKTGQPWKDAQAEKAVQDRNQAKEDAYSQAVVRVTNDVIRVGHLATQAAATLRSLEPPADAITDRPSIWGCVAATSRRFQAVGGDKVLVLVTTAHERSFADVARLDGLAGAKVVALFYQCLGTASWCDWSKGTWQSVFSSARVASQVWLDPAQSEVTSPLVVFDPGRAQQANS